MRLGIRLCLSVGLAVVSTTAQASLTESVDPTLPASARRAVAYDAWNALRLKALDGDASAAAQVGEAYMHGSMRNIPEAMRFLSQAASLGSTEGRRELGLILMRGDGGFKDPDQAAPLIRAAAEDGDAEAEAALGVMYAYGDGVSQDWPLAVEWSRRAAEQNNPWGEANLGLYLQSGRAGPAAPDQAAQWYRKAAAQGFALAETRLGLLYQNGIGVPADPGKAFSHFLRGAMQGDAASQRMLAIAYRDGVGVVANAADAAVWMERAAGDGDVDAMYLASQMRLTGDGVPKNLSSAWDYLLQAAKGGHALAAAQVAIAYEEGGFGRTADSAKARHWLQDAVALADREERYDPAPQGTEQAEAFAHVRYSLGMLTLRSDPNRAIALISRAAGRDWPLAIYQLGMMRHAGQVMPRNDAAAFGLLKQAAVDGISAAAFALGEGSGEGWTNEPFPEAALRWYRRAAALGDPRGWMAMGIAYEQARGVPADAAEALTWYQLAGNEGLRAAQVRLGDIALHGELGQPVDRAVALRWYRLAAQQGDPEAVARIVSITAGVVHPAALHAVAVPATTDQAAADRAAADRAAADQVTATANQVTGRQAEAGPTGAVQTGAVQPAVAQPGVAQSDVR